MINFVKYRWASVLFSFAILTSFIGMYVYRLQTRGYAFAYSVDFTGGAQVLLKFDKPVSALALKDVLDKKGWQGVTTREFSPQEILVRVKAEDFANDVGGVGERMQKAITDAMPEYVVTILQTDSVGPGVGATLRGKSMYAMLLALILMLAYIALRFWSIGFALGAVMALFHDVLVMLAAFLFFDREISINVIGAVLAVLGYSINDTIVIFSQIRENLKTKKGLPLADVVNASINHTLRRTLLTSISTGLPVIAMLVLGGETLRDLCLALLVGIVFGTYSSVYIASPVMMLLYRNKS